MNRVFVSRLAASLLLLVVICTGCGRVSEPAPKAAAAPQSRIERGRVRFVEGYENGRQVAQLLDKPMLVFFTADWCDYCNAMAKDALCEDAVVSLSERFVCVLVDVDVEPAVCQKFEVPGYPTVQFIAPGGVALNRIVGKQPGNQLAMEMQAALQALARRGVRADEPRAL